MFDSSKGFYYNETANEYWVYPKDRFYQDVKRLVYPRWCSRDRVILIDETNKKLINYVLKCKLACPIVTNHQKLKTYKK